MAWDAFNEGNGVHFVDELRDRIGKYRTAEIGSTDEPSSGWVISCAFTRPSIQGTNLVLVQLSGNPGTPRSRRLTLKRSNALDGRRTARRLPRTIRDRLVQNAAKLLLEPIFEADFDPNAYGYRPKRSVARRDPESGQYSVKVTPMWRTICFVEKEAPECGSIGNAPVRAVTLLGCNTCRAASYPARI